MSSRKWGPYSDHEFVSSAMRNFESLREVNNVRVDTCIRCSNRLGVLVLRLEAFEEGTQATGKPFCAYETEWPNAEVMSFAACLFRASCVLCRLIGDALEEGVLDSRAPYTKVR